MIGFFLFSRQAVFCFSYQRLRLVLRKSDGAAIALFRQAGFDEMACGVEIVVLMREM